MAKSYYLSSTDSDLSGGTLFNKGLSPSTSSAGTLSLVVPAALTYDSYAWTEPGEPGVKGVNTGTFTIKVNVTVGGANISIAVQLSRVNSSGVVQASSSATATQSAGSAGVLTFTITNPSLGTWVAGDRLRVTYKLSNSSGMSSSSITLGTGTTNEEIATPFIASSTFNDTLSEGVTSGHSQIAANLMPVSVVEPATATQTFVAALAMSVVLSSAATVSDAVTGGKLFASALTEALSASHGQVVTQTHASAVAEGVASVVSQAAALVTSPSVSETLTTGEALTTNAVLSVGAAEGLAASDTVAVTFAMVSDVTEGVTAIVSLTVQVTEPNGWDRVEELVNAWSEVGGASGQWVEINSNNGNWTLQ